MQKRKKMTKKHVRERKKCSGGEGGCPILNVQEGGGQRKKLIQEEKKSGHLARRMNRFHCKMV